MFGRGLLPLLSTPLEIIHHYPDVGQHTMPWPRKFTRDAAYLFLPFAFVAFLILLGGALLVTWGNFSTAVLVGFCVTAGLLIGFFLLCHLVLYCSTWAAEENAETDPERASPTSFGRVPTSHGPPTPARRSQRMVCADCHGRRREQEDESSRRNGVGGNGSTNNQGVG